ncbi:MAG: MFS transporter [Promethearchaeota archaeon]
MVEKRKDLEGDAGNGKHLVKDLAPFIIFLFLNGGSGYAFFAFAPQILDNYVSEGYVSLILLFQPLVVILFGSFFARISDRIKNRKRMIFNHILVKIGIYIYLTWIIYTDNGNLASFILIYAVRGFSIALGSCESAWFSDFTFDAKRRKDAGENGRHTGISYYFLTVSTAWALGSTIIGFLIQPDVFGEENLPIISLIITCLALIPLAFIKDKYAREPREKKGISFNLKKDLRDLSQGWLVYVAIGMRHFGLITALSILSIVLDDMGLDSGLTGVIMSLNPVLQIAGMFLGTIALKKGVKPLKLFSTGLLLSTVVVTCYTVGDLFSNPAIIMIGQMSLGFAWSFLIIGFEEYIIRNVDWNKRANYSAYRQAFMNTGKTLGQLTYFAGYEFLGLTRGTIFSVLLFFPLIGLSLAVAAMRGKEKERKTRETPTID